MQLPKRIPSSRGNSESSNPGIPAPPEESKYGWASISKEGRKPSLHDPRTRKKMILVSPSSKEIILGEIEAYQE
jgi:hypothetical protein